MPPTAAHLCDATLVLSLAGQDERQREVSQALREVGIADFEFFLGSTPDDAAVAQAMASGAVARFPPCFRCGQEDCGDPGCNNVLLPVQVAVVLSFRALFAHALQRGFRTMAIAEDDIVFAAHARSVFASAGYARAIEASGLHSDAPALVRLGSPRRPEDFDSAHYGGEVRTHDAVTMSNYLFLCNRAFAELAHERLATIDHTADMLIHRALRDWARCVTLAPQLVCDRSWALRTSPSLIHPKPEYLEHLRRTVGESSPRFVQEAARLRRHRKKVRVFRLAFVGLVNCDFGRVVRACSALGLDIGQGVPARDGFAAWQYTVPQAVEHLADDELNDPGFVHVQARHLVVAEPASALSDLARRLEAGDADTLLAERLVARTGGAPGASAGRPARERAVVLYVGWHRLARAQPLHGIVPLDRVETALGPVLAGDGTAGPSLDQGALDNLTSGLAPDLAQELLAELDALGFDAGCRQNGQDARYRNPAPG